MRNYNLGFISDEDIFTLPKVLDDVIASQPKETFENSVFEELSKLSPNLLKSLYLLSFSKYDGFEDFEINALGDFIKS